MKFIFVLYLNNFFWKAYLWYYDMRIVWHSNQYFYAIKLSKEICLTMRKDSIEGLLTQRYLNPMKTRSQHTIRNTIILVIIVQVKRKFMFV